MPKYNFKRKGINIEDSGSKKIVDYFYEVKSLFENEKEITVKNIEFVQFLLDFYCKKFGSSIDK